MRIQYHCFYVNVNLVYVTYPHVLFADNRNI